VSEGFYLTKKYGDPNLLANNKSIDQLDTSTDKARKGVYVGVLEFNGQQNNLFQFENMFPEKERLLNIYFPVKEESDAYFIETDKKLSGQEALFVIRQKTGIEKKIEGIHELKTGILFNSYYNEAKLPDPKLFTEKLDTDIHIADSLYILSFDIYDYQDKIQMLQFVKNAYGYYGLNRSKAYYDKEKWKLKNTSSKKAQYNKALAKQILLSAADIISAGLQLVVAIFYYIFFLIRIIIAFFTGGFVK
jgi:hypothetical protein